MIITSLPLTCLTLNETCVSIRMMVAPGQKRTRRGDEIRVQEKTRESRLTEKTKSHSDKIQN